MLGWFGAIVGLVLLTVGIVGAIVGQIIWSIACTIIAAATGRLERQPQKQKGSARNTYA